MEFNFLLTKKIEGNKKEIKTQRKQTFRLFLKKIIRTCIKDFTTFIDILSQGKPNFYQNKTLNDRKCKNTSIVKKDEKIYFETTLKTTLKLKSRAI